MTPPEDLVRLRHLRDAAEKAVAYSAAKRRTDLDDDELLRLGLTKLLPGRPIRNFHGRRRHECGTG